MPKKISSFRKQETWIGFALGTFVISSLLRFFVHPSGGHVHRQSDTIGMSLEFAERIREVGISALDFIFYPRILQRGLLDGINAAEFPLLNILGAPAFLISSNPQYGVFFSALLILGLNLFAAYFYLPRLLKAWKLSISPQMSLLLWFTSGTLANQTHTVMPEGFAFPLMVMGMVELLEFRNRARFFGAAVLCGLAVAVKPTVVLSLGALAALPIFIPNYKRHWKQILLGLGISLIFPAWWYTMHAHSILSFAEGPQIFALATLNPFKKLGEVGVSGILWLIGREIHTGQFPFLVGWFFIGLAIYFREWILLGLYLLSLVAAVSLDGAHIIPHRYYFIGTSMFSILLMAKLLGTMEKNRRLKLITVSLLVWGVLFNSRINFWVWGRESQLGNIDYWRMGSQARGAIAPQYHLVTDDPVYPQKLLYIGRSGTLGTDVYATCTTPLYSQIPLALVSNTPPPKKDFCHGRKLVRTEIETSFAKWYITLVN
jgi:hypothetical protein